jgi:hypothetical protein
MAICLLVATLIAATYLLDNNAVALEDTSVSDQIETDTFGFMDVGQEFSSLKLPETYTLCNYTTPIDMDVISEIWIYLDIPPGGSQIKAVIYANEPEGDFPSGDEPLAVSAPLTVVSPGSAQWYNFTMDYPAAQNTTYWLGYYANNYTRYMYEPNIAYLTISSQTLDDDSVQGLSWHYSEKTIMSLYANYTVGEPKPVPTPSNSIDAQTYGVAGGFLSESQLDFCFISFVIVGETLIIARGNTPKRKTSAL